MPLFSIYAPNAPTPFAEFIAKDAGGILNVIQRSGCRHAHVFCDGDYFISARLDDNEVWSLMTMPETPRMATILMVTPAVEAH